MKRLLFGFIAVALLVASPVHAQRTTLTGYGGWKWGGTAPVQQGDLNTAASEHFGLELGVNVRDDAYGILMVDYQPTVLRLRAGGVNPEVFDLDALYFMAGGRLEVPNSGRIVPFAVGTLGIAWFNPKGDRDGESAFAGMFGGGATTPLGEGGRVALRLEARMYVTIPWFGSSMYCGGSGCYGSVGGTIGPVQGAVLGGLSLALG